jgi:hypothetical protein
MDAEFDLGYDLAQHLYNPNKPDENYGAEDLDVLESLFTDELTAVEVSEAVLQDACASVSSQAAAIEMQMAFSREKAENFAVPQLQQDKKRFKTVSDIELKDLQERRHSQSTHKATKWGVKAFQGRPLY